MVSANDWNSDSGHSPVVSSRQIRRNNPPPAGSRSADAGQFVPFDRQMGYRAVDALKEVAARHAASPARVAIAWVLSRSAVSSVIIAARKPDQLEDNIRAVDLELLDDESGYSTGRRHRVFPIQSGWSFSSTPQRIRVPGSCIQSATQRADPEGSPRGQVVGMTRQKIGIIGAGAVGSASLLSTVLRGVAREIVVVNRDPKRARGVVADVQYGAALSPAVDLHAGDYSDLNGATLVMIAAGANERAGGATDRSDPAGRLRLLDANARVYQQILPKLASVVPEAVMLVLTDPPIRWPTSFGLRIRHVLSSGTLLDSLRFRFHLARRLNVDAASVEANVLGEHRTSQTFIWSSASVSGVPVMEALTFSNESRETFRGQVEHNVRFANIDIIEGNGKPVRDRDGRRAHRGGRAAGREGGAPDRLVQPGVRRHVVDAERARKDGGRAETRTIDVRRQAARSALSADRLRKALANLPQNRTMTWPLAKAQTLGMPDALACRHLRRLAG